MSAAVIRTEPSSGESRAEVERVLSSEAFRGSEGVSRLLSYLAERSLAGDGSGLKEFTIGVEAFHKPPDYDPQNDPTVRVLASRLRRKLEDYYRTEGANNPIRIEIPKGHYVLRFQPWRPGQGDEQVDRDAAQIRRWRGISAALAVLLAAALFLASHWRRDLHRLEAASARQQWSPDLELLWQPYVGSKRPVLIVLGTPLFTKFSGGFFRDPRLNEWRQMEQTDRLRAIQKMLDSPYAVPWYNFTGIGEANGAFLLGKLLFGRTSDLTLKRSSAISWEDIAANNVIFLGSPKFNPQLENIPFEQEFVIEGGSLRNVQPRPGEPEKFPEIWTESRAALVEDHALITRWPGLHGLGAVTVLAASSTEGTWAAVEYVTRPQHATDLVERVKASAGRLPEAYQVVIRARFKDQVPIQVSYVTHRVLKASTVSHSR